MSHSFDAMFAAILIPVCLVVLAVIVISIVFNCILYKKMGLPAWAAIIPFYGQWVFCEEIYGSGIYIIGYFLSIIPVIGTFASLLFAILTNYRLAKAFNYAGGMTALLTLVPLVGLGILAFGHNEYNKLLAFDPHNFTAVFYDD